MELHLSKIANPLNVCSLHLQVGWSTYMKVKKLYGVNFVPEVAAHPGDETLYVNIADRVNGGKMRIPWKTWLKVSNALWGKTRSF